MRNYIITIYCYDGLLECIYQGDIYGPMMSTVVYEVYIVFTLFPDVTRSLTLLFHFLLLMHPSSLLLHHLLANPFILLFHDDASQIYCCITRLSTLLFHPPLVMHPSSVLLHHLLANPFIALSHGDASFLFPA